MCAGRRQQIATPSSVQARIVSAHACRLHQKKRATFKNQASIYSSQAFCAFDTSK